MNKKRYWLIGGGIILSVWLALVVFAYVFSQSDFLAPIFVLPVVLLSLPANAIDFNSGIFYKSTLYLFGEATFLGYSFLAALYFFLGSIIGFLYGKIKKQKQ